MSLSLLGCGSGEVSTYREQTPSTSNESVEALDITDEVPSASITWESCYQIYECGVIEVPIDYEGPDLGTIQIDLIRIRASVESPLGTLLINFGGPGASGTEIVSMYGSLWEFAFPNLMSSVLIHEEWENQHKFNALLNLTTINNRYSRRGRPQ